MCALRPKEWAIRWFVGRIARAPWLYIQKTLGHITNLIIVSKVPHVAISRHAITKSITLGVINRHTFSGSQPGAYEKIDAYILINQQARNFIKVFPERMHSIDLCKTSTRLKRCHPGGCLSILLRSQENGLI
jgi:hypothetical protein